MATKKVTNRAKDLPPKKPAAGKVRGGITFVYGK
jgi:hypothetical protein